MKVVKTIDQARHETADAKKRGLKIGFVPTMGFLHEGHTSLVETSKKMSSFQVMSIFVNRIQFNNINDFNTYPKDIERDLKMAEEAGVDLLFMPDESEMYNNSLTHVDVDTLVDNLCGAVRPGHFRGVFTVVSKLFNIIQPDISVFGQKDIQQAVSIEKMAADLNFPVQIIVAPIVREGSGLAMSSRNKHLSAEQRNRALSIFRGLRAAEYMILKGEKKASAIISAVNDELEKAGPEKIDYVTLADYLTLSPVSSVSAKSVLAIAAYFGTTRLIDNMIITTDEGKVKCIY